MKREGGGRCPHNHVSVVEAGKQRPGARSPPTALDRAPIGRRLSVRPDTEGRAATGPPRSPPDSRTWPRANRTVMGRVFRPDAGAAALVMMTVPSPVAAVMIPGCPDRNLARENLTDPSRRLTACTLTPLAVTLPMRTQTVGTSPETSLGRNVKPPIVTAGRSGRSRARATSRPIQGRTTALAVASATPSRASRTARATRPRTWVRERPKRRQPPASRQTHRRADAGQGREVPPPSTECFGGPEDHPGELAHLPRARPVAG